MHLQQLVKSILSDIMPYVRPALTDRRNQKGERRQFHTC